MDDVIGSEQATATETTSAGLGDPPLGPLDGRYRTTVAPLAAHLSEAALNQRRVHVEVEWLLYLTGRGMFGTRPAILVPFALYCGTTLMLTSTVWWAAAMQWLPASLALAAGLYFHVGFLRSGDRRQAAGAVAAVRALVRRRRGFASRAVSRSR